MGRFSIKQWLLGLAAIVVVGLGVSGPVVAKSFVQASEDLSSIPVDKVVDGAAFVVGDTVTVNGTVKGDLFCAGNTVTVNGTVEGDVLCAGNSLTIAGTVNGDIRVAGNTIVLKGEVQGSATVAGSSIITDSSFVLGNDLTAGASSVSLGGSLGRDVRVGASDVTVSGSVGRHVDGALETLTVMAGAKIGGNVTYTSEKDAAIATGTVLGSVSREEPTVASDTEAPQTSFAALMMFLFFSAVLFVVFALFIALIAPRYVRVATESYKTPRSFLKAAAAGIATFLVIVPVVLMAFISGIGAFVGLFIMTAYFLALMFAGVLAAYRLGVFMIGDRTTNIFAAMTIGSVALAVLTIIPFIGFVVVVVAGSVGLGMVMLSFTSQYEGRPYSGVAAVATEVVKKSTKKKA